MEHFNNRKNILKGIRSFATAIQTTLTTKGGILTSYGSTFAPTRGSPTVIKIISTSMGWSTTAI